MLNKNASLSCHINGTKIFMSFHESLYTKWKYPITLSLFREKKALVSAQESRVKGKIKQNKSCIERKIFIILCYTLHRRQQGMQLLNVVKSLA